MIGRHVGRLGQHPFVLRLSQTARPGADAWWEIEYEGQVYAWRRARPEDEKDMPKLMAAARTYLQAAVARGG